MKKKRFLVLLLLMATVLSACSFSDSKENGILLYGNPDSVDLATDPYQSKLQVQALYHVKELEKEGLKSLIINKTTILQMMDKQLLRDGADPTKAANIKKLDQLTDKNVLLFASSSKQSDKLLPSLPTIYDGNVQVGTKRNGITSIFVVEDTIYDSLPQSEKSISLMQFHKASAAKDAYNDIHHVKKQMIVMD